MQNITFAHKKFATVSAVLNSDLENEHLKVSELKKGSANTA